MEKTSKINKRTRMFIPDSRVVFHRNEQYYDNRVLLSNFIKKVFLIGFFL